MASLREMRMSEDWDGKAMANSNSIQHSVSSSNDSDSHLPQEL
jgi:hypothetical protein